VQTQAGWPSTRCLNESRGIALGYATEASQVVFEHRVRTWEQEVGRTLRMAALRVER